MIHINGEDTAADGMTLLEWLDENGYEVQRIAVECNERIVPKAEYAKKVLQDGDVVEVVSFVGGG